MTGGGVSSERVEDFARIAAPGAARAKTRPFSIRLSDLERHRLEREAGSKPLGAYVKARLFKDAPRGRPHSGAGQQAAVLSQILGRVAKLQLTSTLSDLAVAAKIGTLVMTPELEQDISVLSREVCEIRRLLMRALGFAGEDRR